MKQQPNSPRPLELLIHVIGWGILFGFPLFFMSREGSNTMHWMEYFRHSMVPLCLIVIFYSNYLFLIPHYLFREQMRKFLIINLILIAAISLGLHFWQQMTLPPFPLPRMHEMGEFRPKRFFPSNWTFFTRDLISLILTVGLSATIRMSYRWTEAETARREAEKSKAEAELKNLKNQLNPHFLLNTLNNIYALITFSPEKAQQAVQDLSKLLRYVLYDNNQTYVPLEKETEFIRNYIELMRIRLSDDVKVETNISTLAHTNTMIAPLLFISLIENAFKHGVSYSEPSFINILLEEQENGIVKCCIENSYFPKNEQDKSGSGIGLESLKKRLELLYPGQYIWQQEIKDNIYTSTLIIKKE